MALPSILGKFIGASQMKVAQAATLDLAKFVIGFRAGHHITELCAFHSQWVNPNELSVPSYFFGALHKHIPTEYPRVKLHLAQEAYSVNNVSSLCPISLISTRRTM